MGRLRSQRGRKSRAGELPRERKIGDHILEQRWNRQKAGVEERPTATTGGINMLSKNVTSGGRTGNGGTGELTISNEKNRWVLRRRQTRGKL